MKEESLRFFYSHFETENSPNLSGKKLPGILARMGAFV